MKRILQIIPLAVVLLGSLVSAHEVYVLDPSTIHGALSTTSPNPLTAFYGNKYEFFLWGFVAVVVLTTILAATVFHVFEDRAWPVLSYIKRYAHLIVRITIGLILIAWGYTGKMYGLELSITDLFGTVDWLAQFIFLLAGIAVTVGYLTRMISLLLIAVYILALFAHGIYMLGYADHLGAYLVLFAYGSGMYSIDHFLRSRQFPLLRGAAERLAPYVFPLMRILFGVSILFAAIYGKFIYSNLALETVDQYELTRFFPFEPLFIVLGAFIVESMAGIMMILGIAVRWTAAFLAFWLVLAQMYFQEPIWPHLILYGVAIAIFMHGYDRYSIEGILFKRHHREPVL